MGLWDHIKPTVRPPSPASIVRNDRALEIVWDDGVHTEVTFRELRLGCPCAVCVEEWTGRRTVVPDQIPEAISLTDLETVGNYAVSAVFSDGHRTGIYAWATLRGLGAVKGP